MKRLLPFLLLIFVCTNSHARDMSISTDMSQQSSQADPIYQYLPSGLTFYADYTDDNIDAERASGSPTATFTAARDATHPATWIDSNGVIQVTTTSNQPRLTKGFYNTTGFVSRPGILIEAAGTNLIIQTDGTAYAGAADASLWTGWTNAGGTATGTVKTNNVACPELSSIYGATSQRYQYTGIASDVPDKNVRINSTKTAIGSVVNTNQITISFYVRSQTGLSGVTFIVCSQAYDNVETALTLYQSSDLVSYISTSWRKLSYTFTVTDATCDHINVQFRSQSISNGDTVDWEVYGVQVEKNSYATSWIPTTTAALTRNGETLTYGTSGNRTASSESIFIKYTPMWNGSDPSTNNRFMASDTKDRVIGLTATADSLSAYPNSTDNLAVVATQSFDPVFGTSYASCSVFKHSSPYVEVYSNSTSYGTYTAGDWTNPAWGNNFYIGSRNDGTTQATASTNFFIFPPITFFLSIPQPTQVYWYRRQEL